MTGKFSNEPKRKEPDLRDLLDNRLLQFVYRTSMGIVQTIYRMAVIGMAVFAILVVIGLVLSWFSS